jgi:uncharacterized membrane protein
MITMKNRAFLLSIITSIVLLTLCVVSYLIGHTQISFAIIAFCLINFSSFSTFKQDPNNSFSDDNLPL